MWSCFVRPRRDIELRAQQISHIRYNPDDNQMFYKENPVRSSAISQALRDFIDFLKAQKGRVLLICHSEKSYHSFVLTEALIACNLVEEFRRVFHGWVDARLLFQQAERANAGSQGPISFSLEALYERHTERPFTAHESRSRVTALWDIIEQNGHIAVNSDDMFYTSTLDYTLKRITWREAVDERDGEHRAATGDTARTASKHEIGWDDVQRAYRANGEQEVTALLDGKVKSGPIARIIDYLNRTVNE